MKKREVYISPFMIEYAKKRNKKIVIKDGEIYLEDIKDVNWSDIVCWTIISLGTLGLLLQFIVR